jgi:hypothetical protein
MLALPLLREVDDQMGLMWLKFHSVELEVDEAGDSASLHNAEAILLESQEIARKFGNKYWLTFQIPLLQARIDQKLGEYSQAAAKIRDLLFLIQSLGPNYLTDLILWIGQSLLGLAEAAVSLDKPAQSARLLGALDRLGALEKDVLRNIKSATIKRISDLTRSRLAETVFQAAWAEGRLMNLEQAIALGLEELE